MEPLSPPTHFSVKEVARRMRTHPATVYRWIASGKLKAEPSQRRCARCAGVRDGALQIPAAALESFQPPALDD
ncbi:helix-turn-helix domain-containing protein [Streptomyces sp. NPDC127038]|uniref:helix-turn-helix domain-containing protein n=1 Tax=Streptomyces sp. NPDC127038 TaxID=3347114 RepID=UPI0036678819